MAGYTKPVAIPRRKSLTRNQRAKLFEKWGGICGICAVRIGVGQPWIDEHMNPREISGDDSDGNRRPVHVACAAAKTPNDLRAIAKVRRIRNKHLGLKGGGRKLPGGRESGIKIKMDGTVVNRTTGLPI